MVLLFFCAILWHPLGAWALDAKQLAHHVKFRGDIFFNVTHSGVQGEEYLLNQQLSNIKLYTDVDLNAWTKIHSLLIYNSVPTPIYPALYFDEAFLQMKSPTQPFVMRIGKTWVNFGRYKNDLIYKPMTKALGQTNEYAVELGYDQQYYGLLSLFPAHRKVKDSSMPFYYSLNAGMHQKSEILRYDVGASYLYSLTESQLMQYNKGFGGYWNQPIYHHVPGGALYANVHYRPWHAYATYVTALRSFNTMDMSYQNKGAQPAAASLQVGYDFNFHHVPMEGLILYDASFQALALQLPKRRVGMGLNIYPNKSLDIQFEYFRDKSYPNDVIAYGANKSVTGSSSISNTFALQLVLHF